VDAELVGTLASEADPAIAKWSISVRNRGVEPCRSWLLVLRHDHLFFTAKVPVGVGVLDRESHGGPGAVLDLAIALQTDLTPAESQARTFWIR